MEILIVGEFSGFAKHLKDGFEQLGHRVVVTFTGDAWKGFKPTGDDIYYSTAPWMIGKRHIPGSTRFKAIRNNRRIERELEKRFPNRVDLIIVINYRFITDSPFHSGVRLSFITKQKVKGAKLIMSVCGGDPAEEYTYPDLHRVWGVKEDLNNKRYGFLIDNSDLIIPTNIFYYEAIKGYAAYRPFDTKKICKSIPLPIRIDDNYSITSCNNRKIVIFHGIIRPREKGTAYIQKAMERIQREFPDLVDCVCRGGMPYDEYVKLFDRVDILIDQTYTTGWGMNAAIGAMKGKCVLAPCSPDNCEHMNIPEIPFVQIKPDAEQIYQTLKKLILSPDNIYRIKRDSRQFVEKFCASKIVAKRYLNEAGLL
ncbi:glycosyltransferase family 1 protein [Bacteroides heparinolyticus]|uniref:Glycosyltransferase family 1 protein n=1 Tax=Prevotella heparinolytica TaxID=28113 RepID=A0A3P2A308_9BACE|nr:glycosyltransferase [Bacteroides heparinolyticus]RRD89318.1 glycosyltransferase family 1 protein [Bacteroides heparinolyticus]